MISGFSNKLRIVTTHAEGSRVELAYGEHPRPAHVLWGLGKPCATSDKGCSPLGSPLPTSQVLGARSSFEVVETHTLAINDSFDQRLL